MKRVIIGAVTVLAISTLVILPLLQTDAEAANSGDWWSPWRCNLQGTWIGEIPYPLPGGTEYYNLKFFSVYHETEDNEGTVVTEWINGVPDPGTHWGNPRGVWRKSGRNTYEYSKMGFIVEEGTGTVLTVVRHAGTITFTDCDTFVANSTAEYLDADMTPIACIPYSVTMKRIVMQKPCQAH
jgi:hypothetical protein